MAKTLKEMRVATPQTRGMAGSRGIMRKKTGPRGANKKEKVYEPTRGQLNNIRRRGEGQPSTTKFMDQVRSIAPSVYNHPKVQDIFRNHAETNEATRVTSTSFRKKTAKVNPMTQKDIDRRDSLGWSILHGALSCFYVTRNISSWLEPTKYYVSFPYGIYSPEVLKDNRSLLAGDKSVYISYKGETVRQNRYLGFSFSPQDWKQIHYDLKNNCSGGSRSLPFDQRWSSKNFTLDKIFNNDKIIIDSKKEIEWYFNLDSWDNLVDFYKSSYYNEYKVPNTKLMSEKRLNRITNE